AEEADDLAALHFEVDLVEGPERPERLREVVRVDHHVVGNFGSSLGRFERVSEQSEISGSRPRRCEKLHDLKRGAWYRRTRGCQPREPPPRTPTPHGYSPNSAQSATEEAPIRGDSY